MNKLSKLSLFFDTANRDIRFDVNSDMIMCVLHGILICAFATAIRDGIILAGVLGLIISIALLVIEFKLSIARRAAVMRRLENNMYILIQQEDRRLPWLKECYG